MEVDSLNVVPVPDGDTGTNMSLTLSSAAEYLQNKEGLPLHQAAEMASHGALMGARGNSGVILSQIFRGIAKYFSGKETAPVREFAGRLDEAVTTAYRL
jgi:dihydroxyacetone kinase-like predicted kinase